MKSIAVIRVVSVAFIFVLTSTLLVLPGAGQQRDKPKLAKPGDPSQDQKPKDDQDILKLGTDLVLLDVTVVDQNNRTVMDLNKEQSEVLEEFTNDINDVTDALQGIIASRQTAMLDALYLSADYANKEGKNRKKAVILVTDGLDNNSYYKFDEVVSHLREADVQIYFIGFVSDLSSDHGLFNRSEKDKAENLLNKLAADTGGKAFYPRELADVHSIAQQISTDLRTQYSIGYYPTNSKRDGTFRTVKVAINGGTSRRLVARTRAGYTAPREGERRSATN